jgi:uncharacterized protein Yka (UPF0111/DUF47 family)
MIKLTEIAETLGIKNQPQSPQPVPQVVGESPAPVKTLTKEEKKALYELVSNYNEYGKVLYEYHQLMKVAENINKITEYAETYALNECGDWMQENTAIRHFKELKKMSEAFKKNAAKCQQQNNEMVSLYEDMGNILEKYFEIKSH